MCVTATVAAIVSATAAVGGTVASVGAAKVNAAQQKLALEMERKQAQAERQAAAAQAAEAEVARMSEYEQQRGANLAFLAISGTRSESFLQGIEKASEKALEMDLANIRMAYLGNDAAALRGIRVNRMTSQAVGLSSGLAQAGAIFSGLGAVGQIGLSYSKTKTG